MMNDLPVRPEQAVYPSILRQAQDFRMNGASKGFLFAVMVFLLAGCGKALPPTQGEAVGEAFGQKVSEEEFYRFYRVALRFSRSGKTERTDEETRAEAWENLVFLKEADRLGITVSRPELEEELKRLLLEKEIKHGTAAYKEWVWLTFREDVPTFERGLEDLLRINKLLRQKMDPEVTVTDEEIRDKYFNQYNNFESEYICFPTREESEKFIRQVRKTPKLWKETFDQKAEKGQEGAAWINIMTIEAQVDLWKMPKEDAYKMMDLKPGEFMAARNYYGETAYRLLHKKPADPAKFDDKMKEYYRKSMTQGRRHQLAQNYFDDLIKRAAAKDYAQERRREREKAAQAAKVEQLKKKTKVLLETTQGVIELKLFPEAAPKACENFIGLAEKGYYNGLTFHRVIKGFMIQGGDPQGTGAGGESLWGKPFEDEFDKSLRFDKPGKLAMANSGPATNGSQFFITTVPTEWLNDKHTIFGEVASGMEVVQKIEAVPTGEMDRPKEPQKVLKVSIKPD